MTRTPRRSLAVLVTLVALVGCAGVGGISGTGTGVVGGLSGPGSGAADPEALDSPDRGTSGAAEDQRAEAPAVRPDGWVPGVCVGAPTAADSAASIATGEAGAMLSPPDWLHGTWVAPDANGARRTIIVDAADIALGSDVQVAIGDRSKAVIRSESSADGEYAYRGESVGGSGARVPFAHRYVDRLDGTIVFEPIDTPGGAGAPVTFTRALPGAVIRPPAWLQGRWRGTCGTTTFEATDIVVERHDEPTRRYSVSLPLRARFVTRTRDPERYAYTVSLDGAEGGGRVTETFRRLAADRVRYTRESAVGPALSLELVRE